MDFKDIFSTLNPSKLFSQLVWISFKSPQKYHQVNLALLTVSFALT